MKTKLKIGLLILGCSALSLTLLESQDDLNNLSTFIEEHREENHNPGIAVSIVKDSAVF